MAPETTYQAGQKIPGTVYRVVRHIATGGMGTVYDVEDTTVGKRYVLKTLHPDYADRKDLARRMEAEARTLGRLTHPNIVEVVTAGATQDDMRLPYYVMERLNGQNLRTILEKKGSLELPHAYRIGIDVLDALDHAHEHQVIHRDVKPENIFLHRNRNGTTTTKLLDFGIVRLLGDAEPKEAKGVFIGTLRYAAPEQLLAQPITHASDLYAVGLVLFEMIAGKSPFEAIGDRKALADAQVAKVPPRLTDLVDVPAHVADLVASALEKDPKKRPKDAFTFSARLRELLKPKVSHSTTHTATNMLSEASHPLHSNENTSATTGDAAPTVATGDATGVDGPDSFTRDMGIDRIAETETFAGPLSHAERHFGTERLVDISRISVVSDRTDDDAVHSSASTSSTGSSSISTHEPIRGRTPRSRSRVAGSIAVVVIAVFAAVASKFRPPTEGSSSVAPPPSARAELPSPAPQASVPSATVASAVSLPTSAPAVLSPPQPSASVHEITKKVAKDSTSLSAPPSPTPQAAPRKAGGGPKLPGPGF